MPSLNTNRNWLPIFVTAILIMLGLTVLLLRRGTEPSLPVSTQVSPATPVASAQQAAAGQTTVPSTPAGSLLAEMRDLSSISAKGAITKQRLAEWRAELAAMPKAEAVLAIRRFLDSKEDAPTHLGFKVGGGGWLDEAPTLRTFLLDELARIDPAAAADYAKIILTSMDSPDEWAVALRDLAAGDTSPDGRALLQQKTAQMLQDPSWQQNPSTGFLEAFDVAVYLGGVDLLPTLSSMVRQQDNPAVAHASYLALDRLVINSPATELAALAAAPELMQGREATRADYFARADVGDPQQRQILESYLLNPAISPAELQTFAGIYPNANYMISPNLLTPTPTPDHNSLVSRDAQALAVAQQWMSDPRFAGLAPVLQKITLRLQMFVQQASPGQ